MNSVFNKRTITWALYDWANSAYTTIVVTIFFPLLFAEYWFNGTGSDDTTTPLGIANAIASISIVISAPILGAIADRGGLKKQFLIGFMLFGATAVMILPFVGSGDWFLALVVYVLSFIGFAGANVFYDSMLIDVAEEKKFDFISAFGYSLGYLGGGIALFVCIIYSAPEIFGIDATTSTEEKTMVFLFTGIWWFVFTLPLIFGMKEKKSDFKEPMLKAIRSGFVQLKTTFVEIKQLKVVFTFLLAYWLYIDGVDTIIQMSADYARRVGIDQLDILTALLITQFVGFPAAIIFGIIGEKVGAKSSILVAIMVYIAVTIYAYFMNEPSDFYILAIVVGLVLGGIQSLSRSLFARLIPANKSAEFFGFYNMIGKLAAVLGPLLMALVSNLTGNPRLSILSVVVLFVAGGYFLMKVDVEEGRRIAKELEK